MRIAWTSYPDLQRPTLYQRHAGDWDALYRWLASFPTRCSKGGTLLGPYALRESPNAQRHNDYVDALTVATFDVDHDATPQRVAECRRRLEGIASIWYPSFSHRPEKPAYRLLVQITSPVPASAWRGVRASLLQSLAIPADPKTSCSPSHSYYVPSHGPESIERFGTAPLYVAPLPASFRWAGPELPGDWEPPQDAGPVDLEAIVQGIRAKATKLRREGTRASQDRATWLERLLAGEALTADGHWHGAVTSTAMTLALMFPETGVNTLVHLFVGSVRNMAGFGSQPLTLREVERRITSAVQKAAKDRLALNVAFEHFSRW